MWYCLLNLIENWSIQRPISASGSYWLDLLPHPRLLITDQKARIIWGWKRLFWDNTKTKAWFVVAASCNEQQILCNYKENMKMWWLGKYKDEMESAWPRRKFKNNTKSYSLNRLRRALSQKCWRGLVNLPASHPKRSGTFEAFGHCISFGIVLALPIFAVGKLFSSFLTSCSSSSAEQATAQCHVDMNKVFILLRIFYSDKETCS